MKPVLSAALWALAASAACGKGAADAPPTLTVFAASSLADAFADLEREFEAAHPGSDVVMTYAGSQVLRLQISQGAPADVFASASAEHVQGLDDAGLVRERHVLATSSLALVVPAGDPRAIERFEDLPRAERLVLGTTTVPIGAYARQLLARAESRYGRAWASEVKRHVVSEESNVRRLRAKVELGEADAAIVYRTDAVSSDRVRSVPIPRELDVGAEYHLARLSDGPAANASGGLAQAFFGFALSPTGQAVLSRHGFSSTPATP